MGRARGASPILVLPPHPAPRLDLELATALVVGCLGPDAPHAATVEIVALFPHRRIASALVSAGGVAVLEPVDTRTAHMQSPKLVRTGLMWGWHL